MIYARETREGVSISLDRGKVKKRKFKMAFAMKGGSRGPLTYFEK